MVALHHWRRASVMNNIPHVSLEDQMFISLGNISAKKIVLRYKQK